MGLAQARPNYIHVYAHMHTVLCVPAIIARIQYLRIESLFLVHKLRILCSRRICTRVHIHVWAIDHGETDIYALLKELGHCIHV